MTHLWPLWLALGLSAGLAALIARRPLLRALRVARACATDPRLPRWLRRSLVVCLLPIPGPVDDVALAVVGVVLVTCYRPVLRAILAESR